MASGRPIRSVDSPSTPMISNNVIDRHRSPSANEIYSSAKSFLKNHDIVDEKDSSTMISELIPTPTNSANSKSFSQIRVNDRSSVQNILESNESDNSDIILASQLQFPKRVSKDKKKLSRLKPTTTDTNQDSQKIDLLPLSTAERSKTISDIPEHPHSYLLDLPPRVMISRTMEDESMSDNINASKLIRPLRRSRAPSPVVVRERSISNTSTPMLTNETANATSSNPSMRSSRSPARLFPNSNQPITATTTPTNNNKELYDIGDPLNYRSISYDGATTTGALHSSNTCSASSGLLIKDLSTSLSSHNSEELLSSGRSHNETTGSVGVGVGEEEVSSRTSSLNRYSNKRHSNKTQISRAVTEQQGQGQGGVVLVDRDRDKSLSSSGTSVGGGSITLPSTSNAPSDHSKSALRSPPLSSSQFPAVTGIPSALTLTTTTTTHQPSSRHVTPTSSIECAPISSLILPSAAAPTSTTTTTRIIIDSELSNEKELPQIIPEKAPPLLLTSPKESPQPHSHNSLEYRNHPQTHPQQASSTSTSTDIKIIVNDEVKARRNDNILLTKLQEAKAMNRKDSQGGAVMYQFALWKGIQSNALSNPVPLANQNDQSLESATDDATTITSSLPADSGSVDVLPSKRQASKQRGPKALLNKQETSDPSSHNEPSTTATAGATNASGFGQGLSRHHRDNSDSNASTSTTVSQTSNYSPWAASGVTSPPPGPASGPPSGLLPASQFPAVSSHHPSWISNEDQSKTPTSSSSSLPTHFSGGGMASAFRTMIDHAKMLQSPTPASGAGGGGLTDSPVVRTGGGLGAFHQRRLEFSSGSGLAAGSSHHSIESLIYDEVEDRFGGGDGDGYGGGGSYERYSEDEEDMEDDAVSVEEEEEVRLLSLQESQNAVTINRHVATTVTPYVYHETPGGDRRSENRRRIVNNLFVDAQVAGSSSGSEAALAQHVNEEADDAGFDVTLKRGQRLPAGQGQSDVSRGGGGGGGAEVRRSSRGVGAQIITTALTTSNINILNHTNLQQQQQQQQLLLSEKDSSTNPASQREKYSASPTLSELSQEVMEDEDDGRGGRGRRTQQEQRSPGRFTQRNQESSGKHRGVGSSSGGGGVVDSSNCDPLSDSDGSDAGDNNNSSHPSNDGDNQPSHRTERRRRECIHWKRGELIGEGTFGRVYKGLNESTGELLALKQICLVDGNNTEVQILRKEIKVMRSLSHGNIVRYIGTDRSDRYLFILMEYVPGGSIASMLTQFGAFNEELLRRFITQILQGVNYLHDKGIIHRDIKGANVLVTDAGIAKLADFGCSKQLAGLCTASLEESLRAIRGSVPWMAPEVIKQSGHGRSADIWSLGATAIEMATGRHPWPEFSSNMAALFHVATSPLPPPIPRHLSATCAGFLNRCLVIDAKGRSTARELLEEAFLLPEIEKERERERKQRQYETTSNK